MLRSRLALASCLVVACAACSQNKAVTAPDPSTSSTSSVSSTPTSSQSPSPVGYTQKERAAYASATKEYDAFVKRNDAYYAAGRTTGAAKKFYQHYAIDWSTAWANLGQAANNKVTVRGRTKTLWTKPWSIKLRGPKADVVVLRRCLDESGRVVTQDGKKLDQPQLKRPHVYTVRLEQRPGEHWWRSGIAKQGPTC